MGGMVLETNMTEILSRIEEQNKLEKQEVNIVIILNIINT
jgi:AP-3 complex subunit sigma